LENLIEKIENLPLFSGIDKQELSSYFSKIRYYEKTYTKGKPLILQGMPYKALYIITKGYCIGEMTDESGKLLKIEDFPAPYTLASALLFADDNRMPVTVWAKTEAEVLIISYDNIISFCQLEKHFMVNLLNDVANKFTFISNKLVYLQFKSLREKILYYLSKQKPDDSGTIVLKQSIQELSTLFGVERPSLSRALIRMEKDGIFERDGKVIKMIRDMR